MKAGQEVIWGAHVLWGVVAVVVVLILASNVAFVLVTKLVTWREGRKGRDPRGMRRLRRQVQRELRRNRKAGGR